MLLVDALCLRRAGITRLLRGWAEMHSVALHQCNPDELDHDDAQARRYALCVLGLGSLSVTDRKSSDWIARLTGRFPDTPLVIVSDRTEPEEAVGALRLGAQGFVPTTTAPQVAMNALSFIMGGGTFFPPGALITSTLKPSGRGRPSGKRRPNAKGDGDNRSDLRAPFFHSLRRMWEPGRDLERNAHAIIGLDVWRARRSFEDWDQVDGAKPLKAPRGTARRKATILMFRPSNWRTRG
ncbi:hypothetical protein ABLE91_11015 [Aquabacter sp. CN5-332]|uniref:hypothetical protein n=1 Tax=Aquabacter sp. CN5-332 TaxID=3156608 RepID=UPI0032B51AE4